MILGDRDVPRSNFLNLQRRAVSELNNIDSSISNCHKFLRAHSLGKNGFHLAWILEQLEKMGCDFKPARTSISIDDAFFQELRKTAQLNALREMMQARIPIPDSYLLVGVADEGPAYQRSGYRNVYILQEGFIYGAVFSFDSHILYY